MRGNLLGTTDKRPKALSPTKAPPILPGEVIEEILVRVPASSLVKLKIVCKSWNALISNPEFVSDNVHRSRADPRLVYRFRDSRKIHFSSVQSLFKNPSALLTKDGCFEMDGDLHILGSCNGLICLGLMSGRFHLGSIRLWNPCTRSASDWLKIRAIKDDMYGFGYDHVHDNYKFLEGCWIYGHKIHTFGSNYWTTIVQDPLSYHPKLGIGTFVYGTLNWAAQAHSNFLEWVILSFDLANENFAPLSLPDMNNRDEHYDPAVGVLRDRLCVCLKENYGGWIFWVMKEYGVQKSWTKLITVFSNERVYPPMFYSLKAMYMTENDDVVAVSLSPSDSRIFKLVIISSNDARRSHRIFGQRTLVDADHQNCYVYQESLVSPSHLGLPSFHY
ncbi:F-box/kelch-repeat protein At3g23880 [Arachis duranensis]|uniref:F-box/kelch-repeat protein At3g23880 n=1 Tax=Arachis duranensis TaxID=130453 RepID=A0A6P5MQI3_ARADU|nr:F-box/kelch-repeat protein At3g23880 [Arachis duranensis]